MLKYLLHSSKSTLGADNKYRYNLDKKLGHDAKTMVLVTLSYSCHSGISPAPHVVYAHSDALSRIIHRKHTVELQDQSHDRSSNIECHSTFVPRLGGSMCKAGRVSTVLGIMYGAVTQHQITEYPTFCRAPRCAVRSTAGNGNEKTAMFPLTQFYSGF